MSPERYMVARARAGRWAGPAFPAAFSLERGIPPSLPPDKKAIYIATGPPNQTEKSEAASSDRIVRYVGSTEQGTAVRLGQHFRDWDRAASWLALWIVPLLEATPRAALLGIEGSIGELLMPIDNMRLPIPRRAMVALGF